MCIRDSFDFDDTLSLPSVQEVAKSLVLEGYDLKILTSRRENVDNSDLFKVANDLCIDDVRFTNYGSKHEYLSNYEADIHIDDKKIELIAISQFTNVEVVDVTNSNWEFLLNQLLDREI